jgi:hypothetical protein
MVDERDEEVRDHVTGVLLALELLARRDHLQAPQARHAELGLSSARKLARILLHGADAHGAHEDAT